MQEKIALLGGTFDPIHLGHLNMAEWIQQELQLDRCLFIPAARPPHKHHQITATQHRLKMLQLAITNNPGLDISTLELKRKGPSYTLYSLQDFAKTHPDAKIWWVIGMDSLLTLHTWHKYQKFIQYARFAVLPRPGEQPSNIDKYIKTYLPMFEGAIDYITMPQLEISSSEIRTRLKAGKTCRYLVHPDVWQYIVEQGLYRSQK